MRKTPLFILILSFLAFSLTGIAYSWQGRMGGMGDPYGLIMDESDFLIHPSKIADGKGINFYGNYRFDWRGVPDWNYTLDMFNPTTGALSFSLPFRTSGHEWEHDVLLGTAMPLGPGRMGLFLQYVTKIGDYDGKENEYNPSAGGYFYHRYSLDSDLDTFAIRLLYGLPMGDFKLGGEVQLSYRNEENEIFFNQDLGGGSRNFFINPPFGAFIGYANQNLFPLMFPYDSKYWEALLKGSLKVSIGPIKTVFTVRGGYIFKGDNRLDYKSTSENIKMDGEVKGWRVRGDLWLRYPLSNDLSLPFLVKMEYQKKTRDGDGPGFGGLMGNTFDYKNREKILQMEAGGGVDKEIAKGMRIGAGIYYGYFKNKNDFSLTQSTVGFWGTLDQENYPDHTEHRVILRLSGEKEISPMVALRIGMNFFYGWVKEDFKINFISSAFNYNDKISLDGNRCGIGASMGATVKLERFSFEPFLGGSYQKLNLNGDGFSTWPFWGVPVSGYEMDKLKKEWSIGGGLSIRF